MVKEQRSDSHLLIAEMNHMPWFKKKDENRGRVLIRNGRWQEVRAEMYKRMNSWELVK